MIGLDTNVLVRYLARDDEPQAAAAAAVLEGLGDRETAFVSQIVLCELWWVLGTAFHSPAEERAAILETLLTTRGIVVEAADAVRAALTATARGADFADALITQASARAGCAATVTFDRRAATAAGMRLLEAGA
ncbi:PIN domain-containing protein [Demequina pelophila]|uniref:PIN domain-containing protein n=1 Tax=Demequina pelophila TaxID=1638984 RepID=UPI000785FBC5|nr:type II toxin-antitoxin system VapC family toxin [Demequina pelophila]